MNYEEKPAETFYVAPRLCIKILEFNLNNKDGIMEDKLKKKNFRSLKLRVISRHKHPLDKAKEGGRVEFTQLPPPGYSEILNHKSLICNITIYHI